MECFQTIKSLLSSCLSQFLMDLRGVGDQGIKAVSLETALFAA